MGSDPRPLVLFGYGSLLTEPESPDGVVERCWGRLHGWRRQLNKRSRARGCAKAAVAWPEVQPPDAFCAGPFRDSLAMGTEVDPDSYIDGIVLVYDGSVGAGVLAQMDVREGWWPERGIEACGYRRVQVQVQVDGIEREAWTYLSNPHGSQHMPHLSVDEQARILLGATPADPGRRACGLRYVVEIVLALREAGLSDPALESILEAVTSIRPGAVPEFVKKTTGPPIDDPIG